MLEEIEMLCQSNIIRRPSTDQNDPDQLGIEKSAGQIAEEQFDEEKLCNICYYTDKDTVIVPCGHMTCNKCILLHTQNR